MPFVSGSRGLDRAVAAEVGRDVGRRELAGQGGALAQRAVDATVPVLDRSEQAPARTAFGDFAAARDQPAEQPRDDAAPPDHAARPPRIISRTCPIGPDSSTAPMWTTTKANSAQATAKCSDRADCRPPNKSSSQG